MKRRRLRRRRRPRLPHPRLKFRRLLLKLPRPLHMLRRRLRLRHHLRRQRRYPSNSQQSRRLLPSRPHRAGCSAPALPLAASRANPIIACGRCSAIAAASPRRALSNQALKQRSGSAKRQARSRSEAVAQTNKRSRSEAVARTIKRSSREAIAQINNRPNARSTTRARLAVPQRSDPPTFRAQARRGAEALPCCREAPRD
jgi:hypothetical protein